MAEQLETRYLLVGGGTASAQASVGIRELDADGPVVIVGQEKWYPYDRPPLTKGFLTKDIAPEDIESKDPSFYKEKNIHVLRSRRADRVERANRTVTLNDGTTIRYEKLLLATGSSPRRPPIQGLDLAGVHLMRTVDDSMSIKESMTKGGRVVMVGGGYIGLEAASAALKHGMQVTIIDPNERPWSNFASAATGDFLLGYFNKQGVSFLMGEQVEGILGDGKATKVRTKGGQEIEGDLFVVGTGIAQNLDLAKQAGLEMDEKEGVVANERLQTSDPNIWVAGDIAAFYDVVLGRRWHADHFMNAKWQGKQAGRIMAGADEQYEKVPYFYSDMNELGMILRGDPKNGKPAKVIGSMENADYVELYAREDGTLQMGLAFTTDGSKLDPAADKLEELIPQRPRIEELNDNSIPW